jgi:hypothetical protein
MPMINVRKRHIGGFKHRRDTYNSNAILGRRFFENNMVAMLPGKRRTYGVGF